MAGLLSVLGQSLDYINHALKVLNQTVNNQYGIRGQPQIDKVTVLCTCNIFEVIIIVCVLMRFIRLCAIRLFYDINITCA